MSKIKYRSDVDGLRAIAVIAVVLFHLDVGWIGSGYLGVDVFFVISGFLITSIISGDINEGNFSLRAFWVRRVRRLFPALLCMLSVTLSVSFFVGYRPNFEVYGAQALSAVFSLSNIYTWRAFGDYWGPSAENTPFLHTWTLSLEEQFYLLYPLFFSLLYKWKRKITMPVVALVTLISLMLFLLSYERFPGAAFYLLPTRFWELSIGGVMALLARKRSEIFEGEILKNILSLVSLSLIVLPFFQHGRSISSLVVLPVIGTAVLCFWDCSDCKVGRLLSSKALLLIGKSSYSIYLWHWPVIVLSRNLLWGNQVFTLVVQLALIFVLSAASYLLVEKRMRSIRKPMLPYAAMVLLSVGLAMVYYKAPIRRVYDTEEFKKPPEFELYPTGPRINYNDDKSTPEIVVVGDSQGVMWEATLNEIADELDLSIAHFSFSGRNPLGYYENPIRKKELSYNEISDDLFRSVSFWEPRVVVFAQAWIYPHKEDSSNRFFSRVLSSERTTTMMILKIDSNKVGAHDAIEFIKYVGIERDADGYFLIEAQEKSDFDSPEEIVAKWHDSFPKVELLELKNRSPGPGGDLIRLGKDDEIYYRDGSHLSYFGTSFYKGEVKAMIEKALEE